MCLSRESVKESTWERMSLHPLVPPRCSQHPGPGWSQEPEIESRPSPWVAGTQMLKPLSDVFLDKQWQDTGSRKVGMEPRLPMWNTDVLTSASAAEPSTSSWSHSLMLNRWMVLWDRPQGWLCLLKKRLPGMFWNWGHICLDARIFWPYVLVFWVLGVWELSYGWKIATWLIETKVDLRRWQCTSCISLSDKIFIRFLLKKLWSVYFENFETAKYRD